MDVLDPDRRSLRVSELASRTTHSLVMSNRSARDVKRTWRLCMRAPTPLLIITFCLFTSACLTEDNARNGATSTSSPPVSQRPQITSDQQTPTVPKVATPRLFTIRTLGSRCVDAGRRSEWAPGAPLVTIPRSHSWKALPSTESATSTAFAVQMSFGRSSEGGRFCRRETGLLLEHPCTICDDV